MLAPSSGCGERRWAQPRHPKKAPVRPPFCSSLQIVAQKRVSKPLFLKYGKPAGKSTVTVSAPFRPPPRGRLEAEAGSPP